MQCQRTRGNIGTHWEVLGCPVYGEGTGDQTRAKSWRTAPRRDSPPSRCGIHRAMRRNARHAPFPLLALEAPVILNQGHGAARKLTLAPAGSHRFGAGGSAPRPSHVTLHLHLTKLREGGLKSAWGRTGYASRPKVSRPRAPGPAESPEKNNLLVVKGPCWFCGRFKAWFQPGLETSTISLSRAKNHGRAEETQTRPRSAAACSCTGTTGPRGWSRQARPHSSTAARAKNTAVYNTWSIRRD